MIESRGKDEQNRDLAREFDAIFDRKLMQQIPHHQAYEQAEGDFAAKYNHKKYSNFDTYRKCRARRIKKR